jgi:hypothetical protein
MRAPPSEGQRVAGSQNSNRSGVYDDDFEDSDEDEEIDTSTDSQDAPAKAREVTSRGVDTLSMAAAQRQCVQDLGRVRKRSWRTASRI